MIIKLLYLFFNNICYIILFFFFQKKLSKFIEWSEGDWPKNSIFFSPLRNKRAEKLRWIILCANYLRYKKFVEKAKRRRKCHEPHKTQELNWISLNEIMIMVWQIWSNVYAFIIINVYVNIERHLRDGWHNFFVAP